MAYALNLSKTCKDVISFFFLKINDKDKRQKDFAHFYLFLGIVRQTKVRNHSLEYTVPNLLTKSLTAIGPF
jgi:hypothetical protein